jgi:hypothetical protein
MTDRHQPDDPNVADEHERDELASAYLDGDATAEEVARVEADSGLMARVAELRAVTRSVAEPVTPPPAKVRDAAIARAVAAATTVDLAAERRRRTRTRLWVASAAAVILAGLIAVPLLVRTLGDNGETDTAGRAADEDTQAESAPETATTTTLESGAGGGDVGPTSAPEELPFLGSFADEDSLVSAARGNGFAPTNGDADTLAVLPACPAPDGAAAPVATYSAELAGEPVTVFVLEDPSGAQRVVAVDGRCEVAVDTTG